MPDEKYGSAFDGPPGSFTGMPMSNLRLPSPNVSSGLRFDEACAKHVKETYNAFKVYIVASRSLAANTDSVDKLISAIGKDRVAGVRRQGISPHTPWTEILEITNECRAAAVDCIVTLGAGSITDGCKIVVLVHRFGPNNKRITTTDQHRSGACERRGDSRGACAILVGEQAYSRECSRANRNTNHDSHKSIRRRGQTHSLS